MTHGRPVWHRKRSLFGLPTLSLLLLVGTHILMNPAIVVAAQDSHLSDEPAEESEKGIIDRTHERISRGVLASAEWLDSFFDDERFEREDNKSRAKLELGAFYEEAAEPEYDANINLRLVLPQTNKRLLLFVTGESLDEPDTEERASTAENRESEEARNKNITLGFAHYIIDKARHNLSTETGLYIENYLPQAFLKVRFRYRERLDSWTFRFIPELIADTHDGFEFATTVDLERPLSKDYFYRFSADGSWYFDEDGYFYDLSMSVFQKLKKKRAIAYQWINSFETEPVNLLTELTLAIKYRQRLWRNWLFLEIVPQLSFPRSRDFKTTPGIFFGIDAIYGYVK